MATYLVTGGCGFIGSHLVDCLIENGHRVRVLDDLSTGKRSNLNPAADLIVGDVVDCAAVRRAVAGIDGCFHLAAIASVARSTEDWIGTHTINLSGFITILDAVRQEQIRRSIKIPVVYASSAAVYGDQTDMPITEHHAAIPLTAYGADKLGCELHARVGWLSHGIASTGLRFFNVYGPRQDPNSPYSGVISIFSARIAAGQAITLHGDGAQVRDFIFVGDVVDHLRAAMATANGAQVFNVCTGKPTAIRDIANLIGQIQGVVPTITHGQARVGDIRQSIGSPDRASACLGVQAEVAIEDGLNRLLRRNAAPRTEAA